MQITGPGLLQEINPILNYIAFKSFTALYPYNQLTAICLYLNNGGMLLGCEILKYEDHHRVKLTNDITDFTHTRLDLE